MEQTAPSAVPAVKALSCPACGGAIELRAAGYTVTLICPYCSSVLDVANPDVQIIQRYEEANIELEIPLGSRGILKGIEWEAIGFLRRSVGGYYGWYETLLFNPYHGYRWLVTDGRGWTFGTMLTTAPTRAIGGLQLDREYYSPFFGGSHAQVDYVLGEFYWRAAVGEDVETADYVRPGWMLSFEGNAQERNWTLGELLDPKEMHDAFGVEPPPRWRPGDPPPLAHQPSPYRKTASGAFKMALAAIAAIFVIMTLFGGGAHLESYNLDVRTDATTSSATIGPISFTRPYQAVTIGARAPSISNAWIDLDYALVNRKTQESFEAYGVAERYSGHDSDGSWTEGSGNATTKMAMIPAGDYDLIVDVSGQKWGYSGSDMTSLSITVSQGGRFWSNFLIALVLLLIPAFFMVMQHFRFEAARTGESDFGGGSGSFG